MDTRYVLAEERPRLSDGEIREIIAGALQGHNLHRVLVVPPDMTRLYSYAGTVVGIIYNLLASGGVEVDILPALGSHLPMTDEELGEMYPDIPRERFFVHDWRRDTETIGEIPAEFVAQISEGFYRKSVPVELNGRLLDRRYDLILSVGQVVPHEVVGMANYNKNLFVGCGGNAMISASHYIGALYGMERIMGRDHTPAHQLFDYAQNHFLADVPILFCLTVNQVCGSEVFVQYFGVGDTRDVFERAISVSQDCNITYLDKPVQKMVAYLEAREFKSLWVSNKAIYRTRMAIADGGELLVIAPGLRTAGEDAENDREIRRIGYRGKEAICRLVDEGDALADNLSVAAHLIHGSSDERFTVTYAPGNMSQEEIESLGFSYMPLGKALAEYPPDALQPGVQTIGGNEIYYIPNPATGLWSARRLNEAESAGGAKMVITDRRK